MFEFLFDNYILNLLLFKEKYILKKELVNIFYKKSNVNK